MKKTRRAPLNFNTDDVLSAPIFNESINFQENKQIEKKTGRAGRQFIAAHVLPEAAKQFKMLALQRDTTTQNLLIEAINDLFAKHKLSRIA